MTELLVVIADRRITGEIDAAGSRSSTMTAGGLWMQLFRFLSRCRAWSPNMIMPGSSLGYGDCFPTTKPSWLARDRGLCIAPRNAFALLGAVGEDCPGAVQLVRPDRVDDILRDDDQQVEWLTEADIAERLRSLRRDQAASRVAGDTGQFSLAGAQPKTAFLFEGQRCGKGWLGSSTRFERWIQEVANAPIAVLRT